MSPIVCKEDVKSGIHEMNQSLIVERVVRLQNEALKRNQQRQWFA